MATINASLFKDLPVAEYPDFIDAQVEATPEEEKANVRYQLERSAYQSLTKVKMANYILATFKGKELTDAKKAFKKASYVPQYKRERELLFNADGSPKMTKPTRRDDGSYTTPQQASQYLYVMKDGSRVPSSKVDLKTQKADLVIDTSKDPEYSLLDSQRYFAETYFPEWIHTDKKAKKVDILADW